MKVFFVENRKHSCSFLLFNNTLCHPLCFYFLDPIQFQHLTAHLNIHEMEKKQKEKDRWNEKRTYKIYSLCYLLIACPLLLEWYSEIIKAVEKVCEQKVKLLSYSWNMRMARWPSSTLNPCSKVFIFIWTYQNRTA